MICAVIDDLQEDLPDPQIFVFAFERSRIENIRGKRIEVIAHGRFDGVPIRTDGIVIAEFRRIERRGEFLATQTAKPYLVDFDQMQELALNRPT
jgi:hypothetical protein